MKIKAKLEIYQDCLAQIAASKRRTLNARLADSCLTFVEQLEKEGRKQRRKRKAARYHMSTVTEKQP